LEHGLGFEAIEAEVEKRRTAHACPKTTGDPTNGASGEKMLPNDDESDEERY